MSDDPEITCQRTLDLLAGASRLASLDALPAVVASWRQTLRALLGETADGLAASRLISAVNDQLTVRIIELTAVRHRLPPVAWCWLAFGSEGRSEQTLVSDQDNGLVFVAADEQEADALRALFLPFAREVNEHLAAAGFERCAGGIMAGNPECCLSLDEWRWRFVDWVRRPDPQALLNATIFFDLRPLCGDLSLGTALQQQFLALTQDTPAFEHLMAANALQVDIPLNFRGEVAADDEPIDLKKYGSRVFVDAARIFALSHGVTAVGTVGRLSAGGALAGMAPGEIAAAVAAFSHLLRLRFEHQLAYPLGGQGVRPDELHDMDRAVLREALRQAKRLQQRLKLNYSL